jgi:hypothetical protein
VNAFRAPLALAAVLAVGAAASAAAQTPQPFPRPGEPARPGQAAPAPPPVNTPAGAAANAGDPVPTEASLGLPVYPGAQFLTSYDAGRGQQYHLFGTNAGFAEIVGYYRTVLKQRGDLTFDAPPIHMFEVGRFREESMAFPPSITVKDYTWGGAAGYVNPKPGAEPTHFRTIIQVVPPPPVPPGTKR